LSIPQLVHNLLTTLRFEQADTANIIELAGQAMSFRRRFLQWAQTASPGKLTATGSRDDVEVPPEKLQLVSAADLLSTAVLSSIASSSTLDIGAYDNYYGMMIIINRVILCLGKYHHPTIVPAFSGIYMDRFAFLEALEEENKQLATMAFETENFLRQIRPLSLLYYKFSLHVAKATFSTTEEWSNLLAFQRWNDGQLPPRRDLCETYLMENFLSSVRQFGGM
jgi:hypothetical protein